jgi:MATE family multidrug resistance protein
VVVNDDVTTASLHPADPPRLWRDLLQLAWPVLIAQVAIMLNGLIDTVMAGRLSALDLAAVGIGASIYASVFVAMMGVLLALPPTIAHLYGGGRHAEIGEEVRQGGWLALALSLLTLVVLTNPEPLLALSHLQPAVELKVRAYLAALAWSVPAQLAFRVFYGFSSGIGRPRPIMVLNLLGLALKVPLNLVFIYGYLGMPALGAAGCGVASSMVAWTVCLLGWSWCYRENEYRVYGIFSRWSPPRAAQLLALIRLGLPIGATFLVDVTAFTFMALFIARLGPTASGAHQIAANLAALLYMLPLAVGNSSGILAGQALGRGDPAAARRVGYAGLALGVGGAIMVSLLLTVGKEAVAGLYTRDPGVQRLAAQLIAIVAIYHLADGLQAVVVNLVRGYKKALVPMLIYAVFLWGVGLAGGVVLGLSDLLGPPRGAAGFWEAAIAGLAIAGLLVTGYWWRLSHQSSVPATLKG